jgi:Ca2+-binding RTX toxin-like protein
MSTGPSIPGDKGVENFVKNAFGKYGIEFTPVAFFSEEESVDAYVAERADVIATNSMATYARLEADPRNTILQFNENGEPIGSGLIHIGNSESEAVIGTSGSDDIKLGAGNDTFTSAGGSDTVDGGLGLDTVVISAPKSNISIKNDKDGTFTLTVNQDIIDLKNVERVKLADGTIALDIDGVAGAAYRIYKAAFARTPDNDGLKFWINDMDTGTSLTTVAAGFVGSAEFKSVYGANPTNQAIVEKLYQNVLGREGESAGIDYWVGELNAGNKDVVAVLAGFAQSPENIAGVATIISDGIFYA